MSKLSFKLFCVEKYADRHGIPSNEAFSLFESKDIIRMLDDDYELLRGYGFDFILDDIEQILELRQ